MVQNILIEFTADAQGLNVGINALLQLGKIDQQTADQFTKANDALKQRQLLLQGNDTALQKFIGSLNNAQKAAIGDTYSKTLTQIKTQLAATNVEAKAFYGEIIKNAQAHIIPETSQEELLAALTIIGSANQSLKEFGNSEDVVATKTKRATTILRDMRQELLIMEETGVGFSQKFGLSFDALSIKAAKLQDHIGDTSQRIRQMSSDTFALEAMVGVLSGVAAGFNVASGAAILFGGDQEDVQKAILKVQAGMQILNGIQQFAALLADQSVAKTGLQVLVKKLFTKTTVEETVAVDSEAASHLANAAAAEAEAAALATLTLEKEAAPVTQTLGALPETVSLGDDAVKTQQEIVAARLAAIEGEVQQTAVEEANTIAKGQNIIATEGQAAALVVETGATEGATGAQLALNTAMELNPLGIVIAAILLLTAGFAAYKLTIGKVSDEEDRREKSLEAMNEANEKAAESIGKERGELEILLVTAKNETLQREERQAAIDKIRTSYPDYLHSISLENLYTKQTTDSIASQIKLIKDRALARALEDLYVEKLKKVAEAEADLQRVRAGGATFGEKVAAQLRNTSLSEEGAQAEILKRKIIDLNEANDDASIVLDTFNNHLTESGKDIKDNIPLMDEYANAFTRVNIAAANFKAPSPFIPPVIKPFNPAEFDQRKKAILDLEQFEIDHAESGSVAQLNLKRKLAKTEHDIDLQDRRLFDAEGNALTGAANEAALESHRKLQLDNQNIDDEFRAKYFKDTIAASEAIVLQQEALGKEGSEAFFNARRDVLIKTANEAKTQEGITAGEIKRINAQLNLDLLNLDIEKANKSLDTQKNLTQKRLDLAEKGSQDELNLEIALLEIDKNLQINNAKGNASLIEEIKAKSLATQLEKILAFNQKVRQAADNTAISDTQHRISELQLQGLKDLDASMIEEKKKLISAEAQLEIDSIPVSGITAERRRELIRSIGDKELADKRNLERDKAESELSSQQKFFDSQTALQKLLNDELLASGKINANTLLDLNRGLNDSILKNNSDQIDKLVALQAAYPEKYKEFQDQIDAITKLSIQIRLSAEREAAQRRQDIENKVVQIITTLTSGFFDIIKAGYADEANLVQDLENRKLISTQEGAKRLAAIKRKQAIADKEQALFNIVIQTAQNIVKDHLNPVLVALDIGVGVAEAAVVLSKPIPNFKKGKINIDGIGTETSDSIPARISKHESVINAASTLETTTVKTNNKTISIKNEEVLTAINEHRFADLLLKIIPSIQTSSVSNKDLITLKISDKTISIKNEEVLTAVRENKFADVVLKIISAFDLQDITVNRNSISTYKSLINYFSELNNKNVSISNENIQTAIKENRINDLLVSIMPAFKVPAFDMPEFSSSLIQNFTNIPQMNDMPAWADRVIAKEIYNSTVSEAPEIDYDKLADKVGKRIGKEFEKHPALQIGFDDEGMYMYMKKKNEMDAYIKKRNGYKN